MSCVCLEPSSTFRSHVIHRSILQVHNESSIIGALGELSTARRCHALRRDAPSHESSQVVTFPIFALALDLPENFFEDKVRMWNPGRPGCMLTGVQITRPAVIMRLLHYPPQTGVVDDRVQGIGAHTE